MEAAVWMDTLRTLSMLQAEEPVPPTHWQQDLIVVVCCAGLAMAGIREPLSQCVQAGIKPGQPPLFFERR